jgi:hypothetical protein
MLHQCSLCNHQVSTIAATIFEGRRKYLVFWFKAIWWIVFQKSGTSALGLKRVFGLGSYQTAITLSIPKKHLTSTKSSNPMDLQSNITLACLFSCQFKAFFFFLLHIP